MPVYDHTPPALPSDWYEKAMEEQKRERGYDVLYGGERMLSGSVWFRALEIDGEVWTAARLRDLVRCARNVQREGVSADSLPAQLAEHTRLCEVLNRKP